MAEFKPIYRSMIRNEGGYILETVKGDAGGMTYAGVSRNNHPDWEGWRLVDAGVTTGVELKNMVFRFYVKDFWLPMTGSQIESQAIAKSMFDFGVNTGISNSIRLAQIACGAGADGRVGPKTRAALAAVAEDEFRKNFFIAKIHYYVLCCDRRKRNKKFMHGWSRRALRVLGVMN